MKSWWKCAASAALAMSLLAVTTNSMAAPKNAPIAPRGSTARVSPPGQGPNANPLNLSPAQIQKLQAINMKMLPELQGAMQGTTTDAQRRARMMAIQKKYRPQMLAILTPEQRKKALAMEAKAKAEMKARTNAAPKSAPRPALKTAPGRAPKKAG